MSGLACRAVSEDRIEVRSSYLVVNTTPAGDSHVYQAGRYDDVVVKTPDGWRFKSKRAIYDTSRVQTLLAYPI
jgi:anthranilate 1,2-dioxygenase small subunit